MFSRFVRMTFLGAASLAWCCPGCGTAFTPALQAGETPQDCCWLLAIQGMDCPSCVVHIEKALEQVPGVARAKVNFRPAGVEVHPKPGARLAAGALIKAVERLGYRAKVVKQPRS